MPQVNVTEHKKRKRGQATVELALGMIFLVLLLVGVADVARIYSEQLAVVDAAGVAARWSALEPTNKGSVSTPAPYANEAAVVAAALGPTVVAQLQPTVQVSQQSSPNSVRVDVTYHHTFLFGLVNYTGDFFRGGSTMPGTISTPTCYSTPGPTATPAPTNTPRPTPANRHAISADEHAWCYHTNLHRHSMRYSRSDWVSAPPVIMVILGSHPLPFRVLSQAIASPLNVSRTGTAML